MKRKQASASVTSSEKRRKQSKASPPINTDDQLVTTKANFNEDVLGVVFDYLEYSFLARKCRFVCLQWNEAFCCMPVLSSHISAPLSDLFESKANGGELYMIRDLSLEGLTKDFDFSLLPKLEKLSLRAQGSTSVPDSIQQLTNLKSLKLFKFVITGKNIESWTKLSKLEELTVKHNREFFEFGPYNNLSSVKRLELFIKNEEYDDYSGIITGKISKSLTHFTLILSHGSISITTPLPNLKYLKVSYCDIKKVDLACIPSLSDILLDSGFTDDSCTDILKIPSLKKALLKSDAVDDKCRMISSNQLEELYLNDVDGESTYSIFFNTTIFSNLKVLEMPNSVIGNRKDFTSFNSLTELNVKKCHIGNNVLSAISKMTQLKSLKIGSNNITKDVFKHMKKLTNLTVLDIEDCGVKDITTLSKLVNITKLNLKNNYLKGDWLQRLVNYLPHLKKLNLEGNELKSLEPLASLTNLQKLQLKSLKFSDIEEVQLHHLSKLECLEKLSINSMRIEDEGAKIIGKCTIKYLKLIGCELNDRLLPFILENQSLRVLELEKNNITNKGLDLISKSYLPFMQKVDVTENKVNGIVDTKFKVVNKFRSATTTLRFFFF